MSSGYDVIVIGGGSPRIGTNPEQLFAAGWSACFEGAIGRISQARRLSGRINLASI
jgi:osmotically inducible protein OsmC